MFDSEDFDLDEDFLNDIGRKEDEYYSQKTESESNSPKRRKIIESDYPTDSSSDEEPDFARFSSKSIEPTAERSESSNILQKKIVTPNDLRKGESFSKENNWNVTNAAKNTGKNSHVLGKSGSNENVEKSRKTLALEILRKGSATQDDNPIEKGSTTASTTRSNPLTPISSFNERNSRVDEEQKRRETLLELFKKPYPKVSKSPGKSERTTWNASSATKSNPQTSNSSYNEKNSRVDDSSEQNRRKSLLESFKKPYPKGSKSPSKFGETTSTTYLPKDRSLAVPRLPLVRKFPGPAGLLPDCPDFNFETGNYLNCLEERNIEAPKEDDSGISEYFSQNTEKLFSAGAWRSMLDDLPNGFLRGHDIATIKKTAKSNSRVSLLAGVIARIDHSRQNPRLILKDLSDSIEATMHPDILLAHPNIFEPGVVMLIRHAGVLGFQTSPIFPTLQFHVMIAVKNIVAVYSEKSRIVTSPWMESILGNGGDSSKSSQSSTGQIQDEFIDRDTEKARHFSIDDDDIDMNGFESDDDDNFASFNIDDLKDSQIATTSSIFSSNNTVNVVDKNEIKGINPSSVRGTNKFVTEQISSAISIEKNPSESSIDPEPKKIEKLRSRLVQFRSNDDARSEVRENVDEPCTSDKHNDAPLGEAGSQAENNSNSTGFGDSLMDSDNDTEDEILSQLDVDSIVTSYNSQA